MKSEAVQLLATLDEAAAMTIARVLNDVKGVGKVAIATASGSIDIHFDDDVTSSQELRAVLRQAGFEAKRPKHGEEGLCCGSCGS